jgi:hypothetical protein
LDADTWARARGWALWKSLITIVSLEDKDSVEAKKQKQNYRYIIQSLSNYIKHERTPFSFIITIHLKL